MEVSQSGQHGRNVRSHVVVVYNTKQGSVTTPNQDQVENHALVELLKREDAILNSVQLTVCGENGQNGVNVLNHVVEEPHSEAELANHQRVAVNLALVQKLRRKDATLRLVQLTVVGVRGRRGANVQKFVEEV